MAFTFWRGDYIVYPNSDGTADIYAWEPDGGYYTWLGDYGSTDEAERYVREMQALPELPEIKPINASVHPLPKLAWEECADGPLRLRKLPRKQQARRTG